MEYHEFGALERAHLPDWKEANVSDPELKERLDFEASIEKLLDEVRANLITEYQEPEKRAEMLEVCEGYRKVIHTLEGLLYEEHKDKSYHHPRHSFNMAIQGVGQLRLIQRHAPGEVSELKILKFIAEALGHDKFIKELNPDRQAGGELTEDMVKDMPVEAMIRRDRGFKETDKPGGSEGNEAISAREVIKLMRAEPALVKLLNDNPDLEEEINNDIGATFPLDIWEGSPGESKFLGFIQPHNTSKTSLEGFVLAQFDLRGAYTYGKETKKEKQIITEGNAEWLELHRRVTYEIAKALSDTPLEGKTKEQIIVGAFSKDQQNKIAKSFIGWAKQQPSFVVWQEKEFYKHCDENPLFAKYPEPLKVAGQDKILTLKETYIALYKDGFDQAKKFTEDATADLTKKYDQSGGINSHSFYELLKDIGAVKE